MTVQLTEEQKIKLLNADDVYSVMQEVLLREEKIDQEKEHFWIIGLASNNMIQFIELVSLGSVNATLVEPMNVFRVAVMKGSVKVILVHNHPSGELNPSEGDQDLTDRLIQVGRILHVFVIDHLIISTESFYSFADTGLLSELEESIKWVPQYELVERIREEEKKIREEAVRVAALENLEKGKKEGKIEGLIEGEKKGIVIGEKKGMEKGEKLKAIDMALRMLAKKKDMEEIMEFTGLSKAEIQKLTK
ncbi:MAG: DNA repair protein [Cyclobacteriaceae bacterium]|jgi:DNA repair protein RadC|nr:DNA repair protein [Cyclobacteriaceae bacterium]